jgi:hypothetical protein
MLHGLCREHRSATHNVFVLRINYMAEGNYPAVLTQGTRASWAMQRWLLNQLIGAN